LKSLRRGNADQLSREQAEIEATGTSGLTSANVVVPAVSNRLVVTLSTLDTRAGRGKPLGLVNASVIAFGNRLSR